MMLALALWMALILKERRHNRERRAFETKSAWHTTPGKVGGINLRYSPFKIDHMHVPIFRSD